MLRSIIVARNFSVSLILFLIVFIIFSGFMFIIVFTKKLVSNSVRNGWNLNFTMVSIINTMLISSVFII